MRLLVTGGSGYLGREILRLRPGAVGTAYRGEGDVRLDVRDAAAVTRVVAAVQPACVIHTAYARDGADAWTTNVVGAQNVAAAAARPAPGSCTCRPTSSSEETPAARTSRPIRPLP